MIDVLATQIVSMCAHEIYADAIGDDVDAENDQCHWFWTDEIDRGAIGGGGYAHAARLRTALWVTMAILCRKQPRGSHVAHAHAPAGDLTC